VFEPAGEGGFGDTSKAAALLATALSFEETGEAGSGEHTPRFCCANGLIGSLE